MNKDNFENKIKQVNLIINFVVDAINSLYEQYLQYIEINLEDEINECNNNTSNKNHTENSIALHIIKKHLNVICNKTNEEETKKLVDTCFTQGYLSINLQFQISYPNKFIIENNYESNLEYDFFISKKDDFSMNKLIIDYSDYIIKEGSFMGYTDLFMLKSIDIFQDCKNEISKSVVSQSSIENAHIGGKTIRSDGNCLLSTFVFEYLIRKNKKNKKAKNEI